METGDREILVPRCPLDAPADDDLPVILQRQPVRGRALPEEFESLLTALPEAAVRAPIGTESSQGPDHARTVVRGSREEDLLVMRANDIACEVGSSSEVDRPIPVL